MTFQDAFSYHNLSSFRHLRGLEEEKTAPEEKTKQNSPEDEIQFVDNTPIESGDDLEYITALQEAYENIESAENASFEINAQAGNTVFKNDFTDEQIAVYSQFFGVSQEEFKNQINSPNSFINTYFQILSSFDDSEELDEKQIEGFTIVTLFNMVQNLDEAFINQNKEDGCIGKTFNWIKETFGILISKEEMELIINLQKNNVELLTKAYNGELTQEDIAKQYIKMLELDPDFNSVKSKLGYIPFDVLQKMVFEGIKSVSDLNLQDSPVEYSSEIVGFDEAFQYLFNTEYSTEKVADFANSKFNLEQIEEEIEEIANFEDIIEQCDSYDEALFWFKQKYGDKGQEYLDKFIEIAQNNYNSGLVTSATGSLDINSDFSVFCENMLVYNQAGQITLKDSYREQFKSLGLSDEDLENLVSKANESESYDDLLKVFIETYGDEEIGKILLEKFVVKQYESLGLYDIGGFRNVYACAMTGGDFFVDIYDKELQEKTGKSIEQYQQEYQENYTKAFGSLDGASDSLNQYISEQKTAVNVTAGFITALATGAVLASGGSLLTVVGTGAAVNVYVRGRDASFSENGYSVERFAKDALVGGVQGLISYGSRALWQGIYSKLAGKCFVRGLKFAPNPNSNYASATLFKTPFGGRIMAGVDLSRGIAGFGYCVDPFAAATVASGTTSAMTAASSAGVNYLAYSPNPTPEGFYQTMMHAAINGGKSGFIVPLKQVALSAFKGASYLALTNYVPMEESTAPSLIRSQSVALTAASNKGSSLIAAQAQVRALLAGSGALIGSVTGKDLQPLGGNGVSLDSVTGGIDKLDATKELIGALNSILFKRTTYTQQDFALSDEVIEKATSLLVQEGTREHEILTELVKECYVSIKTPDEIRDLLISQYVSLPNRGDVTLVLNPSALNKGPTIGSSNKYISEWCAEALSLDSDSIFDMAKLPELQEFINNNAGKRITVMVPDDFSGSGRSLTINTAKALNSLTVPEGTYLDVVLAPSCATSAAQRVFKYFAAGNLAELAKTGVLEQGGTEPDIVFLEHFFETKSDNIAIISTDRILTVPTIYETNTYKNLTPEEQQAVEVILTSTGYNPNMVTKTGLTGYGRDNRGVNCTMASFPSNIIDPKTGMYIRKSPNNNLAGAMPYSIADGVSIDKIKMPGTNIKEKFWTKLKEYVYGIINGVN